jgi:hypothetical protein
LRADRPVGTLKGWWMHGQDDAGRRRAGSGEGSRRRAAEDEEEDGTMRRWLSAAALALALAGWAWAGGSAERMSVQVRRAQVRGKPHFLSGVVGTAAYGTRVAVLATRGDWRRVRVSDELDGWVHVSALTEKRLVLQSGEEDVDLSTTSEEIALANKGFNREVEARYRANNRGARYDWIDTVEKEYRLAPPTLTRFLRAGGVTGGEGGAR